MNWGPNGGFTIKPANKKEDRIDRRLAKNQNGKRRYVFIIRERDGRSVPVIIRSENTKDVKAAMIKNICRSSTVFADENPAYDALHGLYDIKRINHSVAYSDGDICTNGAEGWLFRMRRAEIGQHHHLASKYL